MTNAPGQQLSQYSFFRHNGKAETAITNGQSTQLPKQQYTVVVEIAAPIEQCFAAGTAEEAMMYWLPKPKSIVYDHSKAAEPYGAGS